MSEAVLSFIAAMEAAGVKPTHSIAQALEGGEIVRFHVHGDKPHRQNGWAVLHLDGIPAGAFGSYRSGIKEKWRASTPQRRLSKAEWKAAVAERNRVQAERQAEKVAGWETVAAEAAALFDGSEAADPGHAYLRKKRIGGEGMRQAGNLLLVPMRDADGRIWNVQRIGMDGCKLFLKGGRTEALFWLCGEPGATICIGEGAGTMAAVRRATGVAVVAAFSWKDLSAVARIIADLFPARDLVICADDDAHLVDHPTIKRNLGLDAARAAAAAVGARVAVPPRSK